MRKEVDRESRTGFFKLTHHVGALVIDPSKSGSIIADFLHHESSTDNKSNVLTLAKKYRVDLEDLAGLAMVTYLTPELSSPEKKALLPPSRNKELAGKILQGCAAAGDPLALVHVLTAVYQSQLTTEAGVRDIARLFSQKEILQFRVNLLLTCANANKTSLGPDALTLQGLFFEKEGELDNARNYYEKAVKFSNPQYNPKSRHPMQLPLIAPWNALGYLLKSSASPELRSQAKTWFETGALKGDDPLSYYELAGFEERNSPKWLQYTSKAAASGHRAAIVDLAAFYNEANNSESPLVKGGKLPKTLNWLLDWKPEGASMLAQEWLQAAANIGHKPSMLQLADHLEANGDVEASNDQLRRMLEPPKSPGKAEEWPLLVQLARKRLAGIRQSH